MTSSSPLRKTPMALELVGWLLVGMGVVLRLRQYLINRSLWGDEASLAINLTTRSFMELTQPLDYHQGAPIGFLFIEKLLIEIFGNRDMVLRMFPLVMGLASVYVFYRLSRSVLGNAGLFASLLFSVSWPLVYYSSELKQYGIDVLAAMLLILLSVRCFKEDVQGRDLLLLGIVGMAAIWISHPSTFILAGIGLTLVINQLIHKRHVPWIWIIALGIAWAVSFGAEYVLSFRQLIGDEFFRSYWNREFLPMPPWDKPVWFKNTFFSLLFISFNRTDTILQILVPFFLTIGILSIFRRSWQIGLVITLSVGVTLLASALQIYPLKDRFMLYLVPIIFLLIAEGLERIYRGAAKWNRPLAIALFTGSALVFLLLPGGVTWQKFIKPERGADVKPALLYVAERRLPGDTVYVFHGSGIAFRYYSPFYGLDKGDVLIGSYTTQKKVALENFFDDVSFLKGKNRVWFIFSGIVDCGGCQGDMQAFYVEYLDGKGRKLESFNGAGANAYLYDLGP